MAKRTNIDEYIATFPAEVQKLLEQMRLAVNEAAPQATETISYGIPAFKLNGMLVWFAAHKSHIGLYPRASAIVAFGDELGPYNVSKGAIQFKFDEPLPLALVKRIVEYRVAENMQKKALKKPAPAK